MNVMRNDNVFHNNEIDDQETEARVVEIRVETEVASLKHLTALQASYAQEVARDVESCALLKAWKRGRYEFSCN